jgi:outer membrane protein assembly factor BamB
MDVPCLTWLETVKLRKPKREAIMRIIIMTVSILFLTTMALADTGEVLWNFQGIEDINAMATLPDVDGDGTPDVIVETYDAGATGDHLYCLSGSSGSTIWSVRPESGLSDGGGWGGNCLAISDDLSGDGFPDVLIGTAWGNRSVHAVNGRTGDLIWTFDTYLEYESGWVYSVDTIEDRTGDGKPEVICAVGSSNDRGYILDGADGSVITNFTSSYDALFLALPLSDVNGDDMADILFCGGDNEYRVFCVSGASGAVGQVIWSHDSGASNHAACQIDDITGDGLDDIVIGNWSNSNQVKALDASDGSLIWIFNNGNYQSIMRLVTISDANGDGLRDIAIGSFERAVKVISGADGTLIWQSWAGTTNGGDFWTVDRVDDLNGDGIDEVVGGSFDKYVYLFGGAAGDTIWMNYTGHRLYTVRGSADLSASGSADVLAGNQSLSGSGGLAWAIKGATLTAAPQVPRATGTARYVGDDRDQVDLNWTCSEAYPFRIYLVEEVPDNGREALQAANRAGELSDRDLIDTLLHRSEGDPDGIRLLNETPVTPSGSSHETWTYHFNHRLTEQGDGDETYRLAALAPDGSELVLLEFKAEAAPQNERMILAANLHPNPFNPITKISFTLREAAEVKFRVHDASGRRVADLPVGRYPAGENELRWSAQDTKRGQLPSGLYLITMRVDDEVWLMRGVLLK